MDFARQPNSANRASSLVQCTVNSISKAKPNVNMVRLSLQGLRPSMNLVACRLSRPCIPSKCTFRAALRRTERRYTSRTHLAKAADDEFDAQLENDINESTLAIDEMVTSISKNLFIDTATAYVVGRVNQYFNLGSSRVPFFTISKPLLRSI